MITGEYVVWFPKSLRHQPVVTYYVKETAIEGVRMVKLNVQRYRLELFFTGGQQTEKQVILSFAEKK